MTRKKIMIINLIKSFFITFAVMNIGNLASTNILLLCAFVCSYFSLNRVSEDKERSEKRSRIVAAVIAFLFTVFYGLYADLTGGLENALFVLVFELCTIVGLCVLFFELVLTVLVKSKNYKSNEIADNLKFNKKLFLVCSAIVFVCTIPFLALNFPAVMTPDSLSQYRQVLGLEALNNHHPWVHTILFGIFYKLGFAITGDTITAISFYTVFQMLAVSCTIGYVAESLWEMGIKRFWIVLVVLAFVLYPYNTMYAVTIWKDVLFSMCVLLYTVTITRVMKKWTLRDGIMYVISGLGMCLLRHNGYYAYIASIVVLLIVKRKDIKKYLIYALSVLIVAAIIKGPIARANDIKEPSFAFAMTMPLQQMGRVVAYGGNITEEQKNFLNSINDIEVMRITYEPGCEDPLLFWATAKDAEYVDEHKGEFINTWVKMGLSNFGLYVDAMIDQTKGYWAPMSPEQTVFFGITQGNETELSGRPVIDGPALIKINELITKIYTIVPVYGILYSMGSCLWLFILAAGICINNKKYEKLISFLPAFMLWATIMIAAPLVADLRYSYPLMIALPYLWAVTYAI